MNSSDGKSGDSMEDSPVMDVNPSEFGVESVKFISESLGISGLSEEAARELSEALNFRLKNLLQNAVKFSHHGKRSKLSVYDVDLALKLSGQEAIYGTSAALAAPHFRYAAATANSTSAHRELRFSEDKEIDLSDLLKSNGNGKIPLSCALRSHWLAIEGVQPMIPENPPAQSKQTLKSENADPLSKLNNSEPHENKLNSLLAKLKNTETVNVKQLATHELSVEQQLYYKEITEACVGSDEGRRQEALTSLACDPGLHQMLPRLCNFIAEGVRVNVVQHNLAILIYLMRMVKSLLENQTLFLEKYLHEIIPAVTTCIVSRQLCTRPDVDNHWALRDFASRLMANICKNFNTSTNNIQTRITRMFSDSMKNENCPLVSYYGSIAGLQELGPEVIKVFIIPYIKNISARIDKTQENTNSLLGVAVTNVEKTAAVNIRNCIVKYSSPVLKAVRPAPDVLEDYIREFGSLGNYLHAGVVRSRNAAALQQQRLAAQQAGNVILVQNKPKHL